MKLPVLRPVNISEIYISGDVVIDDSAVIAEGVILQAVKGSKIVIHAGVCIGMGSILKAYDGTIEIKENVVLGAGVLILGNSKIDSQVCISTSTTIYNTSVETTNIIPAGSLLGDYELKSGDFKTTEIKTEKKEDKNPPKSNMANVNQTDNLIENLNELDTESDLWDFSENNINEDFREEKEEVIIEAKESLTQNNNQNSVVGQIYINKLLVTLFPEKQKINKSNNL